MVGARARWIEALRKDQMRAFLRPRHRDVEPSALFLDARQASDHRGTDLMLPQFPAGVRELIADRG